MSRRFGLDPLHEAVTFMHGPPGRMGPVVPGVIVLVVAVDGMVAELDIVVLRAPDEVGSEVSLLLELVLVVARVLVVDARVVL